MEVQGTRYTFRDLYIDLMVPTDGRHYRMLDLDEYADAMADGRLSLSVGIDGLRRWQRFLDQHLRTDRSTPTPWSDFPPVSIHHLYEMNETFGAPVRWED